MSLKGLTELPQHFTPKNITKARCTYVNNSSYSGDADRRTAV
jgi:hypothetical protein